jgi:hypothetical protein
MFSLQMSFSFGRPSCLALALRLGRPTFGRALHVALGRPTCGHADVPCVYITDVTLRLHCGRALRWHPTCGRALCCVGAPILRTCLALRWGA